MSLKQRTQNTQTSLFLKKFKGKTATVGKQGLAVLFNRFNDKDISSTSLHNSSHFDKENLEIRQASSRNKRMLTLAPYDANPTNKAKLTLPKINSRESSAEHIKIPDREKSQSHSKIERKIFSEYKKMRKGQRLHLDDDFQRYPYDEKLCNRYPWGRAFDREGKV